MLAERDERVFLTARCHGIVLVRPLVRSAVVLAIGIALFRLPGVIAGGLGALLVTAAALLVLRAVWTWERTRFVVTTEKVYVVAGTVHRRASAVRLRSIESLGLEVSLAGRLLGYGTLVAGPLELDHVPRPREVYRLVEQLCG